MAEGVPHLNSVIAEGVPEGSSSKPTVMAEEVPEGAKTKPSVKTEGVPEGATSKLGVMTGEVPEGATSQQSVRQEGELEGFTSKHSVMAEAVPEGASTNQSIINEEASEVATSKQCEMNEEVPEGAICKQAGMSERESLWRWTKDLVEKPSKEIIKLMKDDPALISKRITVVCSQAGCTCSNSFERIEFEVATSSKDILENLQTLIERGHCPHTITEVDTLLSCHKNEKTLRTPEKSVPNLQSTNDSVSIALTVTEQRSATVLAGITAVHVASTFGKVKIVNFIVHEIQERIRSPHILECDEMVTSVHTFDPYYLAVLHRQDQVLGALMSHINSSTACSLVYRNVLHNSIRLAVQDDNVRSLKILISAANPRDIHCALLIGIKNRCMKCLKCLCKKGAVLSPSCYSDHQFLCSCMLRKHEVIKDMLLQDDSMVVEELLLRLGCMDCRHMLYYAVCYDNTRVTAFILDNYKKMLSKRKWFFKLPIIIQAVLNNSTSMLEVLLRSDYYVQPNQRHKHYTALNWAQALHFDRCASLLENAGVPYDHDATQNYPPLAMLFGENITSFYYSKSALILRMIQNGNDINSESVNGKTALFMALESRAYPSVRQLLMLGADPFLGRNCLTTFLSRRLIGELLYANVDIFRSRSEVSLLHQLLFSVQRLHGHLLFLLKNAHTIPKCNRKLLNSLHDSNVVSRDIIDEINKYLSTPKSLVLRSRDVVRSHFGCKIHDVVRISNLPSRIKSILTLEGILDFFLSLSFQE